jgi:intraflagellar transport protein 140
LDTVKKVADKAKKQGNFDLAARLYRQLRDNVKAMKCMCKLNDTEKVISFAQNARNPEIYIIAANYLQSADWHNNQDTLKNIVSFYTRAKAFDRLAMFYETCAGLEIDEYKDYKKAIMALKDAVKYWQKSNNEDKGQSVS